LLIPSLADAEGAATRSFHPFRHFGGDLSPLYLFFPSPNNLTHLKLSIPRSDMAISPLRASDYSLYRCFLLPFSPEYGGAGPDLTGCFIFQPFFLTLDFLFLTNTEIVRFPPPFFFSPPEHDPVVLFPRASLSSLPQTIPPKLGFN